MSKKLPLSKDVGKTPSSSAPIGSLQRIPTTSKIAVKPNDTRDTEAKKSWRKCFYDREKKTFCGRTLSSWCKITAYGFVYLIFLTTFTMLVLFLSLTIVKYTEQYYKFEDKSMLYSYHFDGVGLTAVPLSSDNPVIWYRSGENEQYQKYMKSIDNLLNKTQSQQARRGTREKRGISVLGPCSQRPYGYGNEPCIMIRINKFIGWSAQPLRPDSENAAFAPEEVHQWLKLKTQKLWLHCNGLSPWDKEHIGQIKYYPDPPGFDPGLFPANMSDPSQLIAIQITKFTMGLSLSIECKLWYENGSSSIEFIFYVARPRTF